MKVFEGIEGLQTATGTHLGFSGWHTITQEQIDTFAEATGDHQWIHVDPQTAAQGPFGGTIAHGYLTLSLVPRLAGETYEVRGVTMSINTTRVTIEHEGSQKPACVADILTLLVP